MDAAPELSPLAVPTWQAYEWVCRWADGMGGFDVAALENYFTPPNPGSRLEQRERERVRRLLPTLIREDREIQNEKIEAQRRANRKS
jgi:hypothetical protein